MSLEVLGALGDGASSGPVLTFTYVTIEKSGEPDTKGRKDSVSPELCPSSLGSCFYVLLQEEFGATSSQSKPAREGFNIYSTAEEANPETAEHTPAFNLSSTEQQLP